MKINANNDISIYRGETAAIDFKISQRSDYYVPFLVSSERVNPMVCITIGSTRRESKNIVSKQLWLDLTNLPKFSQTTVSDLGQINNTGLTTEQLKAILAPLITVGIMYQFTLKTEVEAGNSQLHFAYEAVNNIVLIDEYDFIVIMALDETITLDMTNNEYYYQIELMDTELMLHHLLAIFDGDYSTALRKRMPTDFQTKYNTSIEQNRLNAINEYLTECITLVTKTFPNHWGHRILDPATSTVARVSAIQPLQPPRRFIVQSIVK